MLLSLSHSYRRNEDNSSSEAVVISNYIELTRQRNSCTWALWVFRKEDFDSSALACSRKQKADVAATSCTCIRKVVVRISARIPDILTGFHYSPQSLEENAGTVSRVDHFIFHQLLYYSTLYTLRYFQICIGNQKETILMKELIAKWPTCWDVEPWKGIAWGYCFARTLRGFVTVPYWRKTSSH
jgi:hypothetical protein